MHILEKQMIDLYYENKNYLSGSSHLIINDVNQKISLLLNDFNFLNLIPKSYFKTHFNLTLPMLSIEDIYQNIDEIKNVYQIENGEINYNNISNIIASLKGKLLELLDDYNSFYSEINYLDYHWSKICFDNNKIFIVKNNEIIDELNFWEIDPDKWFFIQNKLHYIWKARNDTLLHLWFTNSQWIILWYCSFSILDRDYPLSCFENQIKKEQIINMTRAFTINNSPSNLMWWLFHKSYQYIKTNFNQFEYIMTYINQNLWFEGSSFKWASYIPIWLSPMQYLYENWIYTNRKWVSDNINLQHNKLAVIPIVLLTRWIKKSTQKNLETKNKDICIISKEDYFKW